MIKKDTPLEKINSLSKNTMLELIGIEITELGDDFIIGTMPVDHRTVQSMGLLHGGASITLIETLGSIGSALIVDLDKYAIVGVEVNANHIKGMRSGIVRGRAEIIHCGRKTHIWKVDIVNKEGQLVSTGRLTTMVIQKK